MFCPRCGAQIADGSSFCSNCGTMLNPVQQQPSISPAEGASSPVAEGTGRGRTSADATLAVPAKKRGGHGKVVGIVVAAAAVVAIVVVAGFMTSWFGLAVEPAYVLTKAVAYEIDEDNPGEIRRTYTLDRDAHGNITKETCSSDSGDWITTYELDANGYPTKSRRERNGTVTEVKYEHSFDLFGRMKTFSTDRNQGATECSYWPNGELQEVTYRPESQDADQSTDMTSVTEFDDHGNVTRFDMPYTMNGDGAGGRIETRLDWEYNSDGIPTKMVYSYQFLGGERDGDSTRGECAAQTDSAGNVISVTATAVDYNPIPMIPIATFEWQKIDQPSKATQVGYADAEYIVQTLSIF